MVLHCEAEAMLLPAFSFFTLPRPVVKVVCWSSREAGATREGQRDPGESQRAPKEPWVPLPWLSPGSPWPSLGAPYYLESPRVNFYYLGGGQEKAISHYSKGSNKKIEILRFFTFSGAQSASKSTS